MRWLKGNAPELLAVVCLLGMTAMQLSGCANEKALIISGETLVTLGDTFEATATAMDTALDNHAITPAAYAKWRTFGLKFQQAYPLAAELWKVADDTKDEKLQAQASAAIAQMAVDLGAYATLVGVR